MTYSIKTLVGILSDSDLEERISVLEEKLSEVTEKPEQKGEYKVTL